MHKIEGYFDYVVPPLEGFWWQDEIYGVDYAHKVEFFTYEEGLCVQCMHIGPYDDEPKTVQLMDQFAKEQGYKLDFESGRYHHEIYLSDVRRCKPENLKTVIRHPIRCS